MKNDPMIELVSLFNKLIGDAKEEYIFIGKVKNSLPDLKVEFNNIVLNKDDLMITKSIKDKLEKKTVYKNDYIYKISVGDTVVMLKKGEKFIVIDKVVSL